MCLITVVVEIFNVFKYITWCFFLLFRFVSYLLIVQLDNISESLKADLDNLRGGQNILINAVYGQSIQLASCANSTAEGQYHFIL